METYEVLAQFAQQGGLIYFVLLFTCILAYALWPRNKKRFDEAAKIPLWED